MPKIQIMKKLVFPILALVALSACSDDNNKAELESFAQDGEWVISKLIDSGTDESSYFVDYRFTFESGGTLKASSSSDTITGTWSVTNDDSSDDSNSSNDLDFLISFNQPFPWDELNDDWDVQSFSNTQIALVDESSDGDNDELTFSR